MANIQHSAIPDAQRHEPKGIAAASAYDVYVAAGSSQDSGSWAPISRFSGTGWGKYTNTTYVGTNALAISTTEVNIPFTTADTVTQLPISFSGTTSSLLDVNTEKLLFVSAGDLHTITFTYNVYSVSGAPAYMNLLMYGSSDGTNYTTLLGDKTVALTKGAGQTVVETSVFPVTSTMVSYGAKIYLNTNTGTANIINIGLISARIHKARV